MHQHKPKPKKAEYRRQYRRQRMEKIMKLAEKRAREAPKEPLRRRHTPRSDED